MGKALYRKYRSRSLDEIVGQPHVVSMLRRSIDTNRLAHAYLLTGIRGIGKTSIARILAHEISKLPYDETAHHLDIIEIDAASNSSVEDVRDLRDKSMIAPVKAEKKVYIIDEVHMLSKSAFNALLKTLEEPPEHVVFILATTDVHKLPQTILSRVQRFNLRPIGVDDLQSHLKSIAEREGIDITDEALRLIAVYGNGSFRDAISLLDQMQHSAAGAITADDVQTSLGLVGTETINTLLSLFGSGNDDEIISIVRQALASGQPAAALIDQLLLEGRELAYSRPELFPLLDRLVNAHRSQWPDIALLAALVAGSPARPAAAPSSVERPKAERTPAAVQTPAHTAERKPTKHQSTKKTTQMKKSTAPPVELAWQPFTEQVRKTSIGAASILTSCDHEFDGSTLQIYCGKAFNKKRLEKYLPQLSGVLSEMGHDEVSIELSEDKKPSQNHDVAAALAIIGGGEEVDING